LVRFHTAAATALRDHGIDTMFGVMGDANMFMADSFARETKGRFLSTSHESGAVLMAGGYAAVTARSDVQR
jgi:acetolactate synthase I/II/III large subunit